VADNATKIELGKSFVHAVVKKADEHFSREVTSQPARRRAYLRSVATASPAVA
jgi:hypothetical protein